MAPTFRPMARRQAQQGLSLLVGLIMLVMLTLFAISAFNVSNVNLRIAGNMQVRQETLSAAQSATEQVLSSPDFTDPAKPPPADAVVNLNGASYTVKFTPEPVCTGIVDIPSELLDRNLPADFECIPSSQIPSQQSGIFGSGASTPPQSPSLCSNTRWVVNAKVTDGNTGADTTLEQGVGVRVGTGVALIKCP